MYTTEQEKEIDELRKEINSLYEKKEKLIHELADIDYYMRESSKGRSIYSYTPVEVTSLSHYDNYLNSMAESYRINNDRWDNSFFAKEKIKAYDIVHGSMVLIDWLLKDRRLNSLLEDPTGTSNVNFNSCVVCDGVMSNEKGTILMVSDPYNEIVTEPIDWLEIEDANKLIGEIIIVGFSISPIDTAFRVRDIKRTGYILNE